MSAKSSIAFLALLLAAASLSCRPSPAADPDPGSIAGATRLYVDPADDSQYLGKVYQRKSEGFSLAPPAGSRIVERSGIDLVSFVVDAKQWGGSLEVVPTPDQIMTLPAFVDSTVSGLKAGKSFSGLQVLSRTDTTQDGRPAIRLQMSMQAELGPQIKDVKDLEAVQKNARPGEAVQLYCEELITQYDPRPADHDHKTTSRFLVLTLYTPLHDRASAGRTFDAMLPNFQLYDPAKLKDELITASKTGKDWLANQSAEKFAASIDAAAQLYRILVNNQDVGYIQFDEATKEKAAGSAVVDISRGGRTGVLFTASFRSFPSDGKTLVVYGQNQAFWAFTKDAAGNTLGHFSMWDNTTKTKAKLALPPKQVKAGAPTYQLVTPWLEETGTISQDTPTPARKNQPFSAVVTFGGDKSQPLPQGLETMIPQEAEAPLPNVLQYAWPRFVDLTKPSEMAFVTYDSTAHKLAVRTLVVTGKRQDITVDGHAMNCYKCIDELEPNSTTLWVDAAGKIQMMVTSDQTVMIPTTDAAMQTKWHARLQEQ